MPESVLTFDGWDWRHINKYYREDIKLITYSSFSNLVALGKHGAVDHTSIWLDRVSEISDGVDRN